DEELATIEARCAHANEELSRTGVGDGDVAKLELRAVGHAHEPGFHLERMPEAARASTAICITHMATKRFSPRLRKAGITAARQRIDELMRRAIAASTSMSPLAMNVAQLHPGLSPVRRRYSEAGSFHSSGNCAMGTWAGMS